MLLPTLVFIFASLCIAAERSIPHAITLAPRALDTSIPTITLAPVTNFNQSLPAGITVNVTGPQIELITDAPSLNGDALLALGPDAVAALEVAYEENCPNGLDSPNCEASLQIALNVDQQSLQKRVVFVIAPIMVAVMAIEYAMIRKHENAISRIRMPSLNVAMLSSAQGASTVVFATQASGGSLITAVPSPAVDTSSLFSVATVTADTNLVQKGDLIFAMPSQPGFALSQFVQTYGRCTSKKKRSCDPYAQAGGIASQAILQVQPGGVMSDLILIPTDISFQELIQPLAAQLPLVLLFGRRVTALAADSTLLNIVATFLLLAAYAELTTQAPNPTRLLIPASDFSTTQASVQPSASSILCPGQLPNCSNCGGNKNPPSNPANTNGICVGLPQHKNFAAGCPCVAPNDPPTYAPYENMAAINAAQAFLSALAENAVNNSTSASVTLAASGSPTSSSTGGHITVTASSSTAAKPKDCGLQVLRGPYLCTVSS